MIPDRPVVAPDSNSRAAVTGKNFTMRQRQLQNLSTFRREVQEGRAALSPSQA